MSLKYRFLHEWEASRFYLVDSDGLRTVEASDQEFVEWWSIVYSRLSAIAHRFLHDEDAAQDLVQDLAVVAYRRFSKFSSYSHFEAWLTQRARWLALNRLRLANRNVNLEELSEPGLNAEVHDELGIAHVVDLITRLPSAQARVLYLTASGLSTREIAMRMRITEPSVRSLRRHGRLALRKLLDAEEVNDDELK